MRIVVVHPDADSARQLRDVLSAELPEAEVSVWDESYRDLAEYAVGYLPPPEFFQRQSRLRAFLSSWAGVERLLASPDMPPSLPLFKLEDAGMGAQMASYCILETLRWLRHRDEYAAQQQERSWRQLPPEDMADWPVGVFGLGVLGRHVASAFAALGFRVNAYARKAHTDAQITCFSQERGTSEFAAFMRATRVLVLLAPLTPQTLNRFDRETLALLPRGSYVINVARGGLLEEAGLLELLDSGHLAGAALDVFREEPLPAHHPFWSHPKIQITPHIAAVTLFDPAARQIATKIRKLSRNESVTGLVDRARGY